jgi:hypothetical protein
MSSRVIAPEALVNEFISCHKTVPQNDQRKCGAQPPGIAEIPETKRDLRAIPHHIVITNPLIRPGTELTRCNVD